jgi:hypothetical protein
MAVFVTIRTEAADAVSITTTTRMVDISFLE